MSRCSNAMLIALLLVTSGCLAAISAVNAAERCPIDQRQSKVLGQRTGKEAQQAFKAYQAGDITGAIRILRQLKPSNNYDKAYVGRMLGNFYAEKNQIKMAIKYLKPAIDADVLGGVDQAAILRLYADLSLQQKQFNRAISYYLKWIKFTCKQDVQVYRSIAIGYSELKRWDKVLQVAEQGLAVATKPDKDLYQMKLTAYYNKKDYKKAIKVLETMVALFQKDGRLWVQLAQFYLITEDYPHSLATYDLAYKNGFLNTAADVTRLSQLLAQYGSPYRAAKIYQKSIDNGLIKSNQKTLTLLAGLYRNAKELTKAASVYGKAAAIKNDDKLYQKQARLLVQSEQYTAAILVLKKALVTADIGKGQLQFELALAYLGNKQYKAAYRSCLKAAKDDKTKRIANRYLAYIKEKARIYNITL